MERHANIVSFEQHWLHPPSFAPPCRRCASGGVRTLCCSERLCLHGKASVVHYARHGLRLSLNTVLNLAYIGVTKTAQGIFCHAQIDMISNPFYRFEVRLSRRPWSTLVDLPRPKDQIRFWKSSESHRKVIGKSSESNRKVIAKSLGSHWEVIGKTIMLIGTQQKLAQGWGSAWR